MPNVGGKRFPYTPAGRSAAGSYARATGQPMRNGGGNPGRGGYGGGNPGMRSPMSTPRQGMRRPGTMAGLRRPMAPKRRSSINPLAMLGMLRRRNRV
mgnify:CR=1 FL=1